MVPMALIDLKSLMNSGIIVPRLIAFGRYHFSFVLSQHSIFPIYFPPNLLYMRDTTPTLSPPMYEITIHIYPLYVSLVKEVDHHLLYTLNQVVVSTLINWTQLSHLHIFDLSEHFHYTQTLFKDQEVHKDVSI